MFRITWSRGAVLLSAALLVLLPIGCGDGKVSVSGKVVYADGKPLTAGMITFTPVEEGGDIPMTDIQKNGAFAFSQVGVPPGKYRVWLSSPEGEMAVPEGEGEGEPKASTFQVPEKYLNPESSGWTATVNADNKTFTFTIGEE